MGLFEERRGGGEDSRKFGGVQGLKEIGAYRALFE
jgi:hypothetical protein